MVSPDVQLFVDNAGPTIGVRDGGRASVFVTAHRCSSEVGG
jgi:hypothetical protein